MFRHCIQNMGVFGVNTVSVTSFAVFTGAGDGTIKKMAGHDKDWSVLAETQLQGSVASIRYAYK